MFTFLQALTISALIIMVAAAAFFCGYKLGFTVGCGVGLQLDTSKPEQLNVSNLESSIIDKVLDKVMDAKKPPPGEDEGLNPMWQ